MAKQQAQKLNKARQALIDSFLQCLNEDKLPWRQGWTNTAAGAMHNPVSKTQYHGNNSILLFLIAAQRGYSDSRWCTFNQAKEKQWKITKGAKGVPVEFWSFYDKVDKKNVSNRERVKLLNDGERELEDFFLVSRTYTVFNGDCVEGMPPLEKETDDKLNDIEMDSFIVNIKDNMGVKYKEFGNSAFYSPLTDMVTMPPRGQFESQYEFNLTLLHELSHATGHEKRLNRDIKNAFGSDKYAVEELRAEMSSVFMGQYINMDMQNEHIDNHKAYIQSWAAGIKDDPNILFRAIKDAEKISDYLIEMGELERVIETGKEEEQKEVYSLDERIAVASKQQNHLHVSSGLHLQSEHQNERYVRE